MKPMPRASKRATAAPPLAITARPRLKEPDVKMMARCIALDMDCAAVCQFAAAAMSRGSEFAKAICALCADICQACGDECARHKPEHCQACAKACKDCAAACRAMAG